MRDRLAVISLDSDSDADDAPTPAPAAAANEAKARLEAEKHGRESAGEEIRAEMRRIREDERKEMKEKLAKCFEENTLLLRELAESRQRTSDALKSSNESNKEITRMKKEVELL